MLSFWAHEISSEGVKTEQKHVEKRLQLQLSKGVREFETFIGLINYLGERFQTTQQKRDLSMNICRMKHTIQTERLRSTGIPVTGRW